MPESITKIVHNAEEQLKECLEYDQLSGDFTWKRRERSYFHSDQSWSRWHTLYSGSKAGHIAKNGYRIIRFGDRLYKAHRVAWLLVTGSWPPGGHQIDHINGCGHDNRWENIRIVKPIDNCRNKKISKANSSGAIGVCWDKDLKKWRSRISINDKRISLGRFENFDDAVRARRVAEKNLGFHYNHGRR